MRKSQVLFLTLSAFSLATSCESHPAGPAPTGGPQITAEDEAQRLDDLDALAQSSGIASPPEISVVRWVPKDEVAHVMAQCLTEQGFAVEPRVNGFEVDLDVEQEGAYALAAYVCEARYPRIPGPTGPPPVEYMEGLYDYYAGDLATCLEARGHEITDLPSRETFVETFLSTSQWSPYRSLFATRAVAPDDVEDLLEACPEYPADGRLDSFG